MQSLRVMVVEDENIVALEIEDRLKRLGYSVCGMVPSGEKAVEMALEVKPDLILMDIHLAGNIDGIAAARLICERQDIPIVFLTAYADETTVERAKEVSPYGYIVKPFDEQDLRTTIELAISKHDLTRKLKAGEQWLTAVLCSIGDGVIAVDAARRISFINPVAQRLTGWSETEALGKDIDSVYDVMPLSCEQSGGERKGALDNLGWEKCLILKARNGEIFPIEQIFSPIIGERGRDVGAVFVFRDISERLEAEQTIKQERDRAQQYLDVAPILMIALNDRGEITLVNRRGCELLGCNEGELIGKNWFENFIPEEDRAGLEEIFNRLLAGVMDSVKQHECRIVTATGERIIICHATLIKAHDGKPTGILLAAEDLTEQRKTEKEREHLQAQLYQAQKMEAIGTLAAGVAHDFNNLLTAIRGNAELLLFNLEEGNPIRNDIEQIKKAAERAASLTRQLLVFSRKQPMKFGEVDLNRIVSGMRDMLERLIGENITMEINLEEDLPTIQADGAALEQIILNLSVNARDAMPHGGILTIRTEKSTRAASPQSSDSPEATYVRLIVEDTGIGMDRNVLEHALEPFFSTKETDKGTGLGLSVVYGIVKQHGGEIGIESSPGEGTKVTVTLPASASARAEAFEETSEVSEIKGRGEKVLVVEDDEDVRTFLTRLLGEQGYEIKQAGSIAEALKAVDGSDEIDLVLSDVVLPDGSGLDLVDELIKRSPDTAIVLSSGYIDEKSRCGEAYAKKIPFIQKPYSLPELLSVIRSTIDSKQKARETIEAVS